MSGHDNYSIKVTLRLNLNDNGTTSTDGDDGVNLAVEREALSIGKSHINRLSIGKSHIKKTQERFWDT